MILGIKRSSLVAANALACFVVLACGGGTGENHGRLLDTRAEPQGFRAPRAPGDRTLVPAGSYSTNFDQIEKPISEGGIWSRANNAWTDVQTKGGVAYGSNGITNSYDDSYALLKGTFGADQTAEAVIERDQKLTPGTTHEVALLLRFSDDNGNARGYECLFNYAGGIQIVRWNGAMGEFTVLPIRVNGSIGRNLITGDVIRASIIGNVISTYINGTLRAQAVDSTYATGRPGISFFVRPDGSPLLLGLTSYKVTTK